MPQTQSLPIPPYRGGPSNPVVLALTVPDHQGNPLPADAPPPVAPAPAEIGQVLSADSMQRRGRMPGGLWGVALTVVAAAVLLPLLLSVPFALSSGHAPAVHRRGSAPPPPTAANVIGPVVAGIAELLIVALIVWALVRVFRRSPLTTYVGTGGVASFRGDRNGNIKRSQLLLFDSAAELFAGSTRHFYNGIYSGTSYSYRWDGGGRTLLKLGGRHNSKAGTPKPHDPFYFARAAEVAWSNHLLARCQAQLDAQKYIEFRVNTADHVRVGYGVMEFHFGSRTERISSDEIAGVNLKNGVFHVSHKDAKWFSRAGKFNFNYARMANARVFLMALDKLMGLRFN